MIRSFELENKNNHENLETHEDNPFDYFLQSTAWDIRSTYHTTLQATQVTCQPVFGRDMKTTILPSEKTGIEYKKRKQKLSMIPIKKETRGKFLMNTRLETKCY
jgi:hypothetical protein